MLQASFNRDFHEAYQKIIPLIRSGVLQNVMEKGGEQEAFRLVVNYYEFIAAGLRNGDFDEQLVRDCMFGQLTEVYGHSKEFIQSVRDSRGRQTIHEHLAWLHRRWKTDPPGPWQSRVEKFIINRPFPGR
jgi:hypothetical protein